ncbi:hypothetical protein V6Z11_A10G214100 [Gossypium hirsutum]
MCCSITFMRNKLDSARMKEPYQILHIPDILASTLILTYPCGGGIHLTMDLGLGCFRFKAQPRYSILKLLIKQTSNPE